MGNTLAMSLKAVADSNGDFLLNINTEGVPTGEFLIAAGEIEKIIRIVSAEELTPTPTPLISARSKAVVHIGKTSP